LTKKKKKKKKSKIKLLLRDGLFSTLLSLLACYLLSLLFFNVSFFDPLAKALKDFSFLDVYYAERLADDEAVEPNIVLINITQKDRSAIAMALSEIVRAKPKAIGFDIILKEFERTESDSLLAQLINREEVIRSYIIDDSGTKITNHPFFEGEGTPGYVNYNFDNENHVIREFEGFHDSNGERHAAFAVQLARKIVTPKVWEDKGLEKKLAAPRVIDYKGNTDRFLHFTIDDFMVLEDKNILKDKIVLMGYLGTPTGNAFDVEDKHFTPLNEITAGKSLPDMHGMVIHANILSQIVTNRFMNKISGFWYFLLLFVCAFLSSVYFIWLSKRLKISYRTVRKAVLFVFAILFVWLTLVLFKNGVVLKATSIIFVTVFSAGFVKYYKHLVRYIRTKRKFKSYLK